MKKSVRHLFLVLFLIMLLFLVSCKGRAPAGDTPPETSAALRAVQTGSEGVVIRPVPNYPPTTIYDQNEFVALVEVHNRGNFDLDADDCFVQMSGVDPNIITGTATIPHSCAENIGTLEGKNVYNTEGGVNEIEFFSSNVVLPDGVFEYNPNLNFLTCYNYKTRANPTVCIDPLLYQIADEQKTCQPRNVAMGGGQGAPVGVNHVGVTMVTAKGSSRAIFEIEIANVGKGQVLSPSADIRNCASASLRHADLDRVAYNVQLTGASVSCKPLDGFVRLYNGRGKIICTAELGSGGSYETPLQIELDYGYIDQFQKRVKIIQTPQ